MGSPKAAVQLDGSSFLDRVAGAARGSFDQIFAVQRQGGAPASGLETIFEDPHDHEAPVFGVAQALRHAQERCFVIAVDYPLLTSELLRDLRARFEQSDRMLLAPRWSGRVQMLCAGYSDALLARIEERVAQGRLDLRSLAGEGEAEIVSEDVLRRQFPGEALMNVNTTEDLAMLERTRGLR